MATAPTTAGRPAPGGPGAAGRAIRAARALRQPANLLVLGLAAVLGLLVVAPLVGLLNTTLTADGLQAWEQVLASELSRPLFWEPLVNSLLLGAVVAAGSTVLGAGMAWLVMMTDLPLRRTFGFLASLPFVMPSFAIALAWETVFRNDRVGGRVGLLQDLGLAVPDALAWGFLPSAAVLVSHYWSLSFVLIAAALATVNRDLVEAGEMAGASRMRVTWGITMPVVLPAVVAGALLCFAEGVSNFAVPALLGLPVEFHTLSTRLYGAISTGQTERGYVLALLLLAFAALILFLSTRVTGKRRSFATITGKGGRRRVVELGRWRAAAIAAAAAVCLATTILPGLVLVLSSFARRTNSLTGGFTTHFWVGASTQGFSQGQEGVLRNPQILEAMTNTLLLGLSVALAATVLGLCVGYVLARLRPNLVTAAVGVFSYLPFLIPGVALGAAYIAQFAVPIGPVPALYGTFAILVVAGAAYTLPFASQAGRSAVAQVSRDLEESATMAGAGFVRRVRSILFPLTARAMIAGAVLVFVKMVRDISLVILLVTPATPLLSVVTFRYASEGFAQFANAITVLIAAIAILATLVARKLEGASQPWDRA
jgi:iron(III) transport system permease protein